MTVMIIAALATALTLLYAGANSGAILAVPPSPFTPTSFVLHPVRWACRHRHAHILSCTDY